MNTEKNAKPAKPAVRIGGQYLRDVSFENPLAPGIFAKLNKQPDLNISIDVNAYAMETENHYGVILLIQATAQFEGEPIFLVELTYEGAFIVDNATPEVLDKILYIECPRMLFPFARRLVADIVREGGYPPLYLDPVDFVQLYRQKLKRQQEEAATKQKDESQAQETEK